MTKKISVQNSFSSTMLTPYQLNKEVIINENIKLLEAWGISGGILSSTQEEIPENPAFGDKYIIPVLATPNDSGQKEAESDQSPPEDIPHCEKKDDGREMFQCINDLDLEDDGEVKILPKWPAGYGNQIALYVDHWVYIKPKDGMMVWSVEAKAICVYYNDSWHLINYLMNPFTTENVFSENVFSTSG
mgnify:CR=1 FL=1